MPTRRPYSWKKKLPSTLLAYKMHARVEKVDLAGPEPRLAPRLDELREDDRLLHSDRVTSGKMGIFLLGVCLL